MRILHVILSRGFTGAERSAVDTCNQQARDHETAMVVRWRQRRRRAGPLATIRAHTDPRVQVMSIPRRRFALPALRWRVASLRPDIIHAHLEDASRLVARLRTDAVRLATLHMHEFDLAYYGLDAVVCVARWQERLVPPDFGGRVFHWPSAFIPHPRLPRARIDALRAEFGAAPDDFLIGGVGSLIHRKGWDTLLRAFYAADLPAARVVIIGEGRERPEVEALLGARAKLTGYRDDVKDCYQAFDLFVCPSRQETYGLVVLEALDAGLPVLVSDTPGGLEMTEEFHGDVFPVEDVAALAALLRAHYQRFRRGERARVAFDMSAHYAEHSNEVLLGIYATLAGLRADSDGAPALRSN